MRQRYRYWLITFHDNLLDALATPAAFVAGTVVSAAVITDLPPMVKWTAAVIAGGGIAGITQGVTAILRAKSTVLTRGAAPVDIDHIRPIGHQAALPSDIGERIDRG